jgi:hypothetical protein
MTDRHSLAGPALRTLTLPERSTWAGPVRRWVIPLRPPRVRSRADAPESPRDHLPGRART